MANVFAIADDLVPISKGQTIEQAFADDGVPEELRQVYKTNMVGFYFDPDTGGTTIKAKGRLLNKVRTFKTDGTTVQGRFNTLESDSGNSGQAHILLRG